MKNSDRNDLAGRAALVTGGGSASEGLGNGRAICIELARRGAEVLVVDVEAERAERTAAMVSSEGGKAEVFEADVMSESLVAETVAACKEKFGKLDLLVNNAGGSMPGDVVSLSSEDWDRQLGLNLRAAFLTCKYAVPAMIDAGGGVIINVGSIAGSRGSGDLLGYSVAKAGLSQLTRQVALRHAHQGIRCNQVTPGIIDTPLVHTRLIKQRGVADVDAFLASRIASVPLGRAGEARDVANAVAFLASESASFITGVDLPVDGGSSIVGFRRAQT